VCGVGAYVRLEQCTIGGAHPTTPAYINDDSFAKGGSSNGAEKGGHSAGKTAKGRGGGKSISFAPEIASSGDTPATSNDQSAVVCDGTVDDIAGIGACRHALVVMEGSQELRSTIVLVQCVVRNSHHAALRCGAMSSMSLTDCDVHGCWALLDLLSGSNACIELNNTTLRQVQSVWADLTNRPRFGVLLDVQTKEYVPEDKREVVSASDKRKGRKADAFRVLQLKDWRDESYHGVA